VGALGAAGLAANHLLGGGGPASASQDRAEALGAGLAAACIVTPSVEARLKEAAPGRGRGAAASLAGAAPVFAVAGGNAPPAADAPAAPPVAGGAPAAAAAPSDPPPLAAELAWASYALLRNTNAASVAVAVRRRGSEEEGGGGGGWEGLLARGSFPAAAAGGGGPLAAVGRGAAALAAEPSLAGAFGGGDPAPAWLPDRGGGLGGPAWAGLAPPGAGCALVCPLLAAPPPLASSSPSSAAAAVVRGVLILVGDRPRGLSPRDRAWARAVAAKIGAAL